MFVVITYTNAAFLLASIKPPGVYDSRVFLPFLQIISIGVVLIFSFKKESKAISAALFFVAFVFAERIMSDFGFFWTYVDFSLERGVTTIRLINRDFSISMLMGFIVLIFLALRSVKVKS